MKLISRGGRLQLIKSVLSAIPVYFMMSFQLPNWVILKIDRLCRQFLWGRSNSERRGVHLINWEAVTTPVKWGGFGVIDLRLQNRALLMQWQWKLHQNEESLWSSVINVLKSKRTATNRTLLWVAKGSFFWIQLQKLKRTFTGLLHGI